MMFRLKNFAPACVLLCGLILAAFSASAAEPAEKLNDLPRVFVDDFEDGTASRWEPTDPTAWKVIHQDDNHVYNQFKKNSNFKPAVRSPFNRALIKDLTLGDVVLDVKLQSTVADYGHRDMCLFFGYQDDSHLYYVHFGKQMDPHANNIFIVNGEPRKSISTKTTQGTNWDDEWHHARVARDVESGSIEVFFDDMDEPAMTATDKTFSWGRVGVGTFDDTGNFDDVLVYGNVVEPPNGEAAAAAESLPGTDLLTIQEPLDEVMVDGIQRFALLEIEAGIERRAERWHRDYRSPEAYEKSIAGNRERFKTIIGAVDERTSELQGEVPVDAFGFQGTGTVLTSDNVLAQRVRVRVLEGISAEGWLVKSKDATEAKACVVALPDADWSPEEFLGFKEGLPAQSHIPRRLAKSGCLVFVPTLISRDDEYSGNPDVAFTNQPHREFIYRMAFQMGRHIIGYEVQKVLAAVDVFETLAQSEPYRDRELPIGVVGVGEGGLIALYSAALDPRIDAAMVCGYFQPRENVWQEPIYRNVFSQLTEFGDAEIASMIAPRPMVIEACGVPEVKGPPEVRQGRRGGAAPGAIQTATLGLVRSEFDRAMTHYENLKAGESLTLVASGEGDGPAGTDSALTPFLNGLGINDALEPAGDPPKPSGELPNVPERQKRQVDELVEFTQKLYRRSARVRDEFWSKADRSSPDAWAKSVEFYRNYVWEEMIGKLPEASLPANPRTRRIIDEPEYTGYEVVLEVYPDVIAAGILLLPTDLKPGEKRPVVVCQHGLEGTPMSTIAGPGGDNSYNYYKSFAVELAKRGFITYAPQNPYRGMDRFRVIQRMSNPMKRSLFSYIIRQHERTLEWLTSLPNVDPDRIGFYGLSYGGKTAVRVPPILTQYACSICSADYNEWIRKNVSNTDHYSYIFTPEYEMFEWNMGHVANYAELASLMVPRPFMVERGHDDGVAPDEWVAWEYSKVRRLYTKLGIGDRTEIEFFDGPHSIHGVGTYAFLQRHLKWPEAD